MKAIVLGIASAIAIAVGGVWYCPVPWSPALLATAALLALAAWSASGAGVKILLANLAAVLVALAAFEGYLGYQSALGDGTEMEGTITEGFTHPDDALGYAPDAGRHVTARKRYGDSVLYDVVYTIGPDGLRVTPPTSGSPETSCIVFFGDSVTFGEGVRDDETYPALVAHKVAGAYPVRNFAFSGYGPHQMLAALQSGHVERTAACRPVQFFYLGILEHIARVAGLANWDRHGPRFRLDANGVLRRDGNFDGESSLDPRSRLVAWLDSPLTRSLAWQRFFGRSRNPTGADLDLYVAIVLESARLTRQRFPGSTFRMLLWDGRDDPRIHVIEKRVTGAGIPVHRLTAIIPDFEAQSARYLLSRHDGHPNPRMHQRIADYVADILSRN